MEPSVVIISAGTGVPSATRLLAEQLEQAVVQVCREAEIQPRVTVLSLRDYAVDIANHVVTGFAPTALREAMDAVETADALIAVTPVYSASYSGLFKSFMDVLDPEALAGMPVLLAATGGSTRHSLVIDQLMRPLFAYFKAAPLATGVYASPEDWGSSGDQSLSQRIAQAAQELTAALGAGTAKERVAQPSLERMESVPFTELLANISPPR